MQSRQEHSPLTRPESLEVHLSHRLRLDTHPVSLWVRESSDGTVSSSTSTSPGTSSRVLFLLGRGHGAVFFFFLELRSTGARFPQARLLGLLEVPEST